MNRRPRLLGLVIANGFSPESKVFANLLSERGGRYEAMVLHHEPLTGPKDPGDAVDKFDALADLRTVRHDLGWRTNRGERTTLAKGGSWLLLHVQLPRLLAIAHRYRPDLIYSSQQNWDCYAATALARVLRLPQIVHLHYNVGEWLGRLPLARLRAARGVVCVSEFIRRQAIEHGVLPERAIVVHNTLRADPPVTSRDRGAVRASLGIPDAAPLFAFVARLAPEKGHADTLRAFARVLERLPESRLLIAGDGPLRAELEALSAELSLTRAVQFLGHRGDVPDLLGAADVFVHPSRNEPFGLAILEASRQRLPTIAYRGSGPSETILDGEGGLLVEPQDVRGLADAMHRLGADRDLASGMGEAAHRDLALRFDPRQQAERFADFLEAARR